VFFSVCILADSEWRAEAAGLTPLRLSRARHVYVYIYINIHTHTCEADPLVVKIVLNICGLACILTSSNNLSFFFSSFFFVVMPPHS